MSVTLTFCQVEALKTDSSHLLVVGRAELLQSEQVQALLPADALALWEPMLKALKAGDDGAATGTWLPNHGGQQLVAAVLPEPCSRHNSRARPHALKKLVAEHAPKKGDVCVVVALEDANDALAAGCAVARAYPLYSQKSAKDPAATQTVQIAFISSTGAVTDLNRIDRTAAAVRRAARLGDTPTCDLHTDAFVAEARSLASELGAAVEVIQGQDLAEQGFGGLWGVGKAAVREPALVVLKHEPAGATQTTALVGKGIVYDTGGLSLKGSANMVGMKGDMGGAAAVLGAFEAAVRGGYPNRLLALLCLAENAIGPQATRPDDIIRLYSGKTVEVNNTDAEGRLVLGDGVAYAVQHLAPDVVIDVATLTGAQMIATGKRHAAVVSNDVDWEQQAVAAGRRSGDLVHPLPYCPEFYRAELKSKIADMRNSVQDRLNAQSSCAAQFVAEHLGDYQGPWLHVDIAGPAGLDDRATGFGVALLVELLAA